MSKRQSGQRVYDNLILSFSIAMMAVTEHGRADILDKEADDIFIRAMQMLADEQREFCRANRIKKVLRVAIDPTIS